MLQVFAKRTANESSGGSGLRKYRTWAYLNAEGKKIWGGVFPYGEVPIQSMIARVATLEGVDGVERVFRLTGRNSAPSSNRLFLGKSANLVVPPEIQYSKMF